MSLVRSEAMFLRNTSQPASTWLDRTHRSLSTDRTAACRHAITRNPLEAVESRPVGVAAHVDPITPTGSDAAQRSLDRGNPPRVVNGGDAVFRHEDGSARDRARVPDRRFERLRPELFSPLST